MPDGIGYPDPFMDAMAYQQVDPGPDPFAPVGPETVGQQWPPPDWFEQHGAAPATDLGVAEAQADLVPEQPQAVPEPQPAPDPFVGRPGERITPEGFRLIMDPAEPGRFQLGAPEDSVGLSGERVSTPQPLVPEDSLAQPTAEAIDPPPATEAELEDAANRALVAGDMSEEAEFHHQIRKQREAEDAQLSGMSEILEQNQAQLAANQAALAENRHQIQDERDAIYAEAQELAGKEIDPDRWWSSRSTGQKFASFIAAAIGGMLSPHRGGRNTGLDLITGEIDRDIATQKANLAGARAGLAQRRGLVGDLVAQGKDAWTAGETARVAMLDGAIQKLKIELGQRDPEGTDAMRLKDAIDQLESAKAAHQAKVEKVLWDRSVEARELQVKEREQSRKGWTWDPKGKRWIQAPSEGGAVVPVGPARGTGSGKPTAGQVRELADELGLDRDQRERLVVLPNSRPGDPSSYGLALTRDKAKSLQGRINATNSFVKVASRLARSIKKYGWEPDNSRWASEEGAKMSSDRTALVFMLKDMEKGGALDKGLVETIGGLVGDEKAKLSNSDAERLENTIHIVIDRAQANLAGDTGNAGLVYKPAWSTAVEAGSPGVGDRVMELQAARNDQERDDASKGLVSEFERSDYNPFAAEEARKAISELSKVPKEQRSYIQREGGSVTTVDPVERIGAWLSRRETKAGKKEKERQQREADRVKAVERGTIPSGRHF